MENPYLPKNLLDVFKTSFLLHPEVPAQLSKNESGTFIPRTYEALYSEISIFSAGLSTLGLKVAEPVGLISDNRKEWLVADLAILALRAADVPRGRDTLPQELVYILGIPECQVVIVENSEQLEKILGITTQLPALKTLVVLDPLFTLEDGNRNGSSLTIYTYENIREKGQEKLLISPDFWEKSLSEIRSDDLATIIFTSGTTGEPKGVMLTHDNFCHQLKEVHKVIAIETGDVWLSVLPVWHVFERVAQYIALYTASTLAYSKPIGKIMLADFLSVKPMWMASVPRIWEAIKVGVDKSAADQGGVAKLLYNIFVALGAKYVHLSSRFKGQYPHFKKHLRIWEILWTTLPSLLLWPLKKLGNLLIFSKIIARLGGRFKGAISGGGTLPPNVDLFFASAGITMLNGYGLTETAPVIAIRNYFKPVLYTLDPLPDTQIKIVNDQGVECIPGEKGLIMVKGGQVMTGYFKNPTATKKILSSEGWLNTGDLGMWTAQGQFVIQGRAKDTIVLSGGENVEPGPMEGKLRESKYIEQALVVGQDKKFLAALVQPDFTQVEIYLKENNIPYIDKTHVCELPEVHELINGEIANLINGKTGFRPFERIVKFALIEKPFELGLELSAKQEVKRHYITEIYGKKISKLYDKGDL